jgi:hypothetical protein
MFVVFLGLAALALWKPHAYRKVTATWFDRTLLAAIPVALGWTAWVLIVRAPFRGAPDVLNAVVETAFAIGWPLVVVTACVMFVGYIDVIGRVAVTLRGDDDSNHSADR